jgi:hypothetical protein
MLDPLPVIIMRIVDVAVVSCVVGLCIHNSCRGQTLQALAKGLVAAGALLATAAFWLNFVFNYN